METYIAQCRTCLKDVTASPRFGDVELDAMTIHGTDVHSQFLGKVEAGEILRHYTVRSASDTVVA